MLSITAIVPCLNEQENLEHVYWVIRNELGSTCDLEILFIDDGSSDGTLNRIKSLAAADPRVEYISFSRNFGLEAAFTAGFKYARKDWVIQFDADMQFHPREAHKLIAKAMEGYDVVFAVRPNRHDSLGRRLGSRLQQWIARVPLGIALPLGASVARIVRTSVAKRIVALEQGMPYFIATIAQIGARYALVPIEHCARRAGRSKWSLWRLVAHSFDLFVGFSDRLLYCAPAAALGTAAVLGALAWFQARGEPSAALQFDLVLAAILMLQLALAIHGLFLRRVIKEVQGVRLFHVRESSVEIAPDDSLYEFERQPARMSHAA